MQPLGDKKPTLLIAMVGLWLALSSCALPGVSSVSNDPGPTEDTISGLSVLWTEAPGAPEMGELRRDPAIEEAIRAQARQLGGSAPSVVAFYYAPASRPQPLLVTPGAAWYFSIQALRGLRFENEFAAAVSAALAVPVGATTSGPESSWRAITRQMIRSLYRNGYDPRGVAAFWKAWGMLARQGFAPGTRQLAWAALAAELEQDSHGEIAQLPPLLNPVVRTPGFARIGKRLQKL